MIWRENPEHLSPLDHSLLIESLVIASRFGHHVRMNTSKRMALCVSSDSVRPALFAQGVFVSSRLSSPARWFSFGLAKLLLLVVVLGVRLTAAEATGVAQSDPTPVAQSPQITTDAGAAKTELTIPKAIVLGLVEGITEFLPISSTGHLLVAERLMDVGQTDSTKRATDAYTVIIQLGAILAVLVVSWKRVQSIIFGLIGKSPEGRKLLLSLVAAFVPTVVVALALKDFIEKKLLRVPVVAAAWIVGALAILLLANKYRTARAGGLALEQLTPRHAVLIGLAQSLALWPGMSRSLVTILAAVVLGYSLVAAVEFSFLLGLATLGAASLKSIQDDGQLVFDTFGSVSPLIGIAVAFVSAALAVKWMVSYLNDHDLTIFAQYRIAIGVATLALLGTTVL
jgi:undecaprenyl-diphosphatase